MKPTRSQENYRQYDKGDLERLWQIMQYRKIGLKLKKNRKLLVASEDVKEQILEGHIEEMQKARFRLEEQLRIAEDFKKRGLPTFHEKICK